jgi:uncharacterized NAD(P)/FAD-binding protein YdhS
MTKKRIAIVGGGPSGLFMYKRLIESGHRDFSVDIFESGEDLGPGMPYSYSGANTEHVTNVSGNEIPALGISLLEWISGQPEELLRKFNLDPDEFTEYKVVPRLLFGKYLSAQFELLEQEAKKKQISTRIHFHARVMDIVDLPEKRFTRVVIGDKEEFEFDQVIICIGHHWPLTQEGKVEGYFDSPYPPSKLRIAIDHPVAIKGSSLTAIDAIRTLARQHGVFRRETPHRLSYQLNEPSKNFKIVMHSRQGLLPAIRFHLDDPKLSKASLLSKEQIVAHRKENQGFLLLDFIFEKDFKESFITKDPDFYQQIKDMRMEEFVETMMNLRERTDPFLFFKGEYAEAKESIRRKQSVYWKEMLAVLSFAMNYPAKHLSAEDMQRLKHTLMPLISIVIAFVPQSSCEELIALHDAGILSLVAVGTDGEVKIHPRDGIVYHYQDDFGREFSTGFKTFIDCTGQRHLNLQDFPFRSLVQMGTVSAARIKFRSSESAKKMLDQGTDQIVAGENQEYYLEVPGIAITDNFRAVENSGATNPRIHVMAVPYMGGFNPDYSGLDFCEEASKIIAEDIFKN